MAFAWTASNGCGWNQCRSASLIFAKNAASWDSRAGETRRHSTTESIMKCGPKLPAGLERGKEGRARRTREENKRLKRTAKRRESGISAPRRLCFEKLLI